MSDGRLACVVLAHTDPRHVQRLVAALDPWRVYLHCDASTPVATFAAMTAGLPETCTLLPRLRTGWARWENVAAELAGYRAALADDPSVTHLALLTGSDYPVATTADISTLLGAHQGRSFAAHWTLPREGWGGRSGGVARLRYRHLPVRKRMLRWPVPRRLPSGVALAAGSQVKVLARHHVEALLAFVDARPDLVAFWRRSWIADESFVPSMLATPGACPGWADEHLPAALWFIKWERSTPKSPTWLTTQHLPELRAAASPEGRLAPAVFARKFSTLHSHDLLDTIDQDLRLTRTSRPA